MMTAEMIKKAQARQMLMEEVYKNKDVKNLMESQESLLRVNDYYGRSEDPEGMFIRECNIGIALSDRITFMALGIDLDGMLREEFKIASKNDRTVGELVRNFFTTLINRTIEKMEVA